MVFCCVSSSFSAVLWLKQFITAVQLHPLASLCGICSGESGTGMGFSLKTSVSFVSIIPPCGTFIHLFIHLLLMVCNLRKWQHHQITYSHNNSPPPPPPLWMMHTISGPLVILFAVIYGSTVPCYMRLANLCAFVGSIADHHKRTLMIVQVNVSWCE